MKKVKNFKLLSTSKKVFEFKKLRSKYIILYFYPKDDTPGCTLETRDFNSYYNKLKKLGCEIFGISRDNIESHLRFKKKYCVKFDLLSDENKSVIKQFKVWDKKKFMGKEFMGLIRSTFIIKNNNILKEWRNIRVKGHAEEIYNFIKDFESKVK